VASRSGEEDSVQVGEQLPEGGRSSPGSRLLGHSDSDSGAEITVHLKLGYKTVLLVVVVFDLVHLSIREIYSASWFEQLLGLSSIISP